MTSTPTPPKGLGRLGRTVCRLLLGFYPRDFRREVGADWLDFLADQRREPRYGTRVIGGARFWADVGLDVVATAFRVSGSGEVLRPGSRLAKARTKSTGSLMDSLGQDVRYAFRALLRSPGFSGVVVLTLALGIGANTAMYSLVHGVILTPLPYPDSERLVRVGHSTVAVDSPDGPVGLNSELYLHYRELNHTLEDIAIFRGGGAELTGDGETERFVAIAETTEGFPDILRVQPVLGRWFDAGEVASEAAVVVLGHRLWSTRYGEDPSIVGRTIRLSDNAHEVIGVMPEGFSFPYPYGYQLWRPYRRRLFRAVQPFDVFRHSQGLARLKPDVTPQDAEADLNALIPRVREAFPGDFARFVIDEAGLRPDVQTLKRREVAGVERRLWILQGTVAFVLLIACANVANLFLVRGQARQRAVAIRVALGAGRARLLRWYLAESTLLAVTGGALGLAIAHGAVRLFVDLTPASFRRWADVGPMPEVGVDANVLLFTLVVSLATSLVFAVTLGLRSPSSLVTPFHEGCRGTTMGRFRFRGRHALVVSQVALALVLLVGSGLMTRSFWNLDRLDPGFDASDVLMFSVGVPRMDRESVAASQQELLERLEALPGVEAAGAARFLPLNPCCELRNTLVLEGAPLEHAELAPSAVTNIASPGFFEALRIPLLAGRVIERSDHEQLTDAVVVSASLAETLWPGEDAIGKRVHLGVPTEAPTWLTVVGVVGDVQPHDLAGGRDASRTIYTPMRTSGRHVERNPRRMKFVVRASVPPLTLADAVRGAVRSVYGGASVGIMSSLEERVSSVKAPMRVTTLLVGLAALLALGLATIGVYGVSSYVASQVTGEIGIRMALGATARDVSRMMLRQGGSLVFVGLVIGLAGATLLTGVMKALLFEVTPTDPVTYAIVSVLLLSVALVATYLPARRAAHVDPVEALRAE